MTKPALQQLPFVFAKNSGLLLQEVKEKGAKLIFWRQPLLAHLNEVRRFLGRALELEQVSEESFNQHFLKSYETNTHAALQMAEDFGEALNLSDLMQELPKAEDLLAKDNEAPIIRLLNALLHEAIKERASDLHLESFEERMVVRFRVDGMLREVLEPPRILAPLLISRIKVMAKLDIAEKRLPQDGRISLRLGGRLIDVRVSTMPTNHGERIVLRLLDKQNLRLDLAHLGMDAATRKRVQALIHRPHGIILMTGPTGSGKTTSLYAMLSALNDRKRNILTVEDPIEYDLPGIGQTAVNAKVQMTFAKGLRAILRQDPDVVMVGEIRDLETAQIAIQASLTGHLVLSTLHTNSALGSLSRLADMGIEAFLLASSLLGVAAQRLLRLLCPACKQARPASLAEISLLGLSSSQDLFHPRGCEACKNTGFSGRSGIYEFIEIDEKLRELIHERAPETLLRKHTRDRFRSLQQDGFRRVLAGETSLEEVLALTSEHS